MASYGYTFNSGDGVTPARLNAARTVSDIVNADINASAAIAGTKIAPDFGSQNIVTTGTSTSVSSFRDKYNNTSTDPAFLRLRKARGTSSSPAISQNNDLAGVLAFDGHDGADFVVSARIAGEIDGTPGASDMPGRLVFGTTADGASAITERMRIDSSGRVGIGTSSPGQPLDVNGSVRVTNTLFFNTAAPAFRFASFQTNQQTRFDVGVSDAAETGSNAGSNFFINRFNDAAGFVEAAFFINRANGRVGLGTETPSSRLHVSGDITVSSATVATSATAGTNGDVPAQVAGYLVVSINGTSRKIPYYAT